ncbi:MAG: hypothetical protein Q7I97_04000 [Thermovirgaceae bacterium]|nr:hypothetical protein [Thermovirgaceae bacterium]
MTRTKKLAAIAVICFTLTGGAAMAVNLGDLIGVVGGGLLVSSFSGQINDFINTITLNKGVGVKDETKVVPIVSVGSGISIGAAQVAGLKADVDRVQAVAEVAVSFMGKIGVRILVPIDSKNPLDRFRRVQKVGVSAIIDYKL